MKNSEKLFLAINEIDDKFVDEAKTEEQRPVQIKLEKRKPIKEIVLFAACFAVIAAAMFALVKFKLSEDIDAIESNSTDSSFDSSDMSENSDYSDSDNEFPLHLSEDDLALQEILKELIPYTEDIDELFNYRPAAGSRYKFSYTDSYGDERSEEYYRFYDGMRSTNDLFDTPQSYDEMETLLTRYFSKLAAESYLSYVSKTDSTKSDNGWFYDIDCSGVNTFIETDGKLFFRPCDFGYLGMGIDPSTAKVKSKTNNVIEFRYWDEDLSDFNGEEYSNNIGYIVKENGEWKLHYFDYYGFTSEIPAEYTNDDLEVQEILETLRYGDRLNYLLTCPDITKRGTYYTLAFPEIPGYEQGFGYIDLSSAEQYYDFPSSYEDFEQQLLKYFSQAATDEFMKRVAKGTIINTADGVTYVKLTESKTNPPAYVEIDGRMFYESGAGGFSEENMFNTAKLIGQTDDTIIYSYTFGTHGELQRLEGRLVYERGGWKRDEFYDPAADKDEFQDILSEILPAACDLDNMFNTLDPSGEEYVFVYSDGDYAGNKSSYYPVTDSLRTKPNDLFAVPQSRSEMEALLLQYFSKRAVNSYMKSVSTGSMTENADGTYSVITDQDYLTPFIEIDGRLYCDHNFDVETLGFDPSTASVITKTEKTIKFKYTVDGSANDKEGTLVYENGWKLEHFKWGFISEFPTEFTAEDEELQDILNDLSPSTNIAYWFNSAGDTYNADQFIFEGLENAENYPTYFVKLETGKFDGGKEEYPRSYDELQELLPKYFTQQTVDYFAKRSGKGTIIGGSDKKYYVKTEKPITDVSEIPSVIELDGVMYHMISEKSPGAGVLWDSARLISKTDNTIEYSYVQQFKEYTIESGTLKFERGGWRIPLI